ncbi:hypothetical protein ACLOJK_023726 [Asimina triloba]
MTSSAAHVIFTSAPSRDLCRISLELVSFSTHQCKSLSLPPSLWQVTVGQVRDLLLSSSLSLFRSLSTPPLFPDLSASSLSLPVSILLRRATLLPLSPSRSLSTRPPHPSHPAPCSLSISLSLLSLSPYLSFSTRPSSLSRPVSPSPLALLHDASRDCGFFRWLDDKTTAETTLHSEAESEFVQQPEIYADIEELISCVAQLKETNQTAMAKMKKKHDKEIGQLKEAN